MTENKIQILNENRGDIQLREYVEINAENDPSFFRWLFDLDLDNDFDMSLSEKQKERYLE